MPTPEQITATVHRYLELVAKGAPDEVVELYASDATLEDPVGGEVHIGRQAIRGFYANIENVKGTTEIHTLRALVTRRLSTGSYRWTSATASG